MTAMDDKPAMQDDRYQQALASVEQTLQRLRRCSDEEKQKLRDDLHQLTDMSAKLASGRVEIVVFGEISTGKSALINALVGQAVAAVDVQGGWTKEVWHVDWSGCGYCVPGLADSQVVLVDTPGLNEVGGTDRASMAHEAAQRADLILFVTDSDVNEIEYSALLTLAAVHKPIIFVLNKMDLYSPAQRQRLLQVLRDERLVNLIPKEHVVMTAADPREVEYVIEAADGSTRNEWRTPPPDVTQLKSQILEVLEKDGLALLALNAAMYAADKSDRIATLRVQFRDRRASQTIWSYAAIKSAAVALNPIPVADVLGGGAVDVTMVVTLAHIYGLEMSWMHARKLVGSIAQAAGWVMLGEYATHLAAQLFKGATGGLGTALTAVPQGAAAGYGSYIVGQAAKYYFEHGASWGGQSPKAVVHRILEQTDKQSVLEHLKDEIKKKMQLNPHAAKTK
jgi:GTP-binding protein Era